MAPTLDLLDKSSSVPVESHTQEELQAWRQEFLNIGLPSYRPTYIYLLRVLLDIIHEAIKIRLEQQLQNRIGEPSFLSIRQVKMKLSTFQFYNILHVLWLNVYWSKLPTQHSEQCVTFHLFLKQFLPNSAYVYTITSVIKSHQQIKSTSKNMSGKKHWRHVGSKVNFMKC